MYPRFANEEVTLVLLWLLVLSEKVYIEFAMLFNIKNIQLVVRKFSTVFSLLLGRFKYKDMRVDTNKQ